MNLLAELSVSLVDITNLADKFGAATVLLGFFGWIIFKAWKAETAYYRGELLNQLKDVSSSITALSLSLNRLRDALNDRPCTKGKITTEDKHDTKH